MTDVLGRLHLFVLAGGVALHNQLLSQGDAFFRAAITLLPDVPVSYGVPRPLPSGPRVG
jgi:hypothetical protein